MISIDALIAEERAVLDSYTKTHTGSELAAFVAKRTRAYVVQEIEKAVACALNADDARIIVRSFREF